MTKINLRGLIKAGMQEHNEELSNDFRDLGNGGHYTQAQKEFAFGLICKSGLRATARALNIPRQTLQRWCRHQGIFVPRCPDWFYGWANRRRTRREFWQRRGY